MKWIIMALFCPRFFKDMPKNKSGYYFAEAISTSIFRAPRIVYSERVKGFRKAYLKARWMALKLDWKIPWEEIWIEYVIRKA